MPWMYDFKSDRVVWGQVLVSIHAQQIFLKCLPRCVGLTTGWRVDVRGLTVLG